MPLFTGKISVYPTRTGKIALHQDSEGAFELPKDTDKLYKRCIALAKEHKLELNIWTPDTTAKDNELVVMARRGYESNPSSRPYFAFVKKRTTQANKPVTKLA